MDGSETVWYIIMEAYCTRVHSIETLGYVMMWPWCVRVGGN